MYRFIFLIISKKLNKNYNPEVPDVSNTINAYERVCKKCLEKENLILLLENRISELKERLGYEGVEKIKKAG